MKEEKNYSKEFLAVFDKFSYCYPKWQIWNDFLYLSAVSMANVIKTDAWEEREKRYLEIIHKYPEEYRSLFPEMFGLIMLGLESNPEQDLLGTLYHRLHLEQEQKGQFFTPYHISHLWQRSRWQIRIWKVKKNRRKRTISLSVILPAEQGQC